MEAEEFFETYDAIHEQGGHTAGNLTIRVRDACCIQKVLWSTFDFMSGPEVRFAWEVNASASVSPASLSGEDEDGSVNDAQSLNSSVTASIRSSQFEDIDDPLAGELTSAAELMDSMIVSDYPYSSSPINERDFRFSSLRYLDEYMNTSTTESNATLSTLTGDSSQLLESYASTATQSTSTNFESSSDSLRIPGREQPGSSSDGTTVASPPTNFVGTPLHAKDDFDAIRDRSSTTATEQTTDSSRTVGSETATSSRAEAVSSFDFDDDDDCRQTSALTTSCVDSGIGATISTHSDLSALCQSPLVERSPNKEAKSPRAELNRSTFRHQSSSDSLDSDMLAVMDFSMENDDEPAGYADYIAKFVLAEQICSTQLPSHPLMHKLSLIRSRRILIGSFIFSGDETRKGGHSERMIHALSFIMPHTKLQWYSERQSFMETVLIDTIPRLLASMAVDDWEDVVVRATSELTKLLSLFACLERFSLISPTRPLAIKQTLLCRPRLAEDKLLTKAISGVLQSQGHCVVIGSNHLYVSKLLTTLAMFVPEELRWCCVRAYRHRFSPYLRLQAIRRSELPSAIQAAVWSSWPICLIDVDRSTVCVSASYSRHRVMRQKAEEATLAAILDSKTQREQKTMRLEINNCRIIEHVKTFLKQMDSLPAEESARRGFVEQFMLVLENYALAFVDYVKDASEPLPTEKASPVKSSRFSLSECRKALDLTSDAWYNAVLARAELLQPDLAEFIYGP